MSIQEDFAEIVAGSRAVRRVLDGMSPSFGLLLADSESRFVAANSNLSWAQRPSKRLLDLAIAVPALIVLAPLLALLALLVRLDSPGPALFRQRRLGYRGQPFEILKLRTMKVLEDGEAITQARPDDERVTRIGRWLRASSLDELPQLINVVTGEMSLIGPRPHARAHDDFYARAIAGYAHRQNVKPGITGWAQIHGLRGATPTVAIMSQRVDFDVWYAQHASFGLDLEILLRTPLEVLRRRNAY